MKNLLTAVSIVALLVACSKKDDADKKEGEGTAKVTEATKPEPFKGEITYDVLRKANRSIQLYTPAGEPAAFKDVLAAAKIALGEPTHTEGKQVAWGVVGDETCAYYAITDKDGKADSSGAQQVNKAMESMHNDCLKALGKYVEPEPDPNAPKVPAEGELIAPTTLIAGVAGDKKAWVGQKVSLKAAFFSATTTRDKNSDKKWVTVSLVDNKDNTKDTVGCSLGEGAEAPSMLQYTEVVATGTVTDTFGGGLDDCELKSVKADGKKPKKK